MFTGIIQATGTVVNAQKINRGRRITIDIDKSIAHAVPEGGSVAIDGVCLTSIHGSAASRVPPKRGIKPRATKTLTFELMDSTLARTTLGARKIGDRVNLESAMRAQDIMGGHFVSGHVDGVGVVKNVKMRGRTRYMVIAPAQSFMPYLVPQGSVAVNGVSLTVVEVIGDTFSVALTPYTAKHTNLGTLKAEGKVNIETDMFAKYIFNFLKHYGLYAGSHKKISHRRGNI